MDLRLLFLGVTLLCIFAIDGRSFDRRNIKLSDIDWDDTALQPAYHKNQKRGWASILIYGGSMLVRTTSYGLTIAALVTGGCSYEPSICRNKDVIEKLDKEITEKKAEFDDLYVQSATNWVNLRDAHNNNGYINYYINESMESVTTITAYQELLEDKLKLKLPDLYSQYNAADNMSSEVYLEALVGQLDVSLDELNKMLKSQANGELIGLIIQATVEVALDSFAKSYTKIYNDMRLYDKMSIHREALLLSTSLECPPAEAAILLDPTHPEYDEALVRNGLESSKITTFERLEMAPKVLSEMFSDSVDYVKNKFASLREWGDISTWDEFKEKSYRTLEGPINMYHATKEFIFNENSRKYTIENFELDWSTKIMATIGAIVDIIMTVADAEQWHAVAKNMEDARKSYEEYLAELNKELDSIKAEQKDQEKEWKNIIETFKDLSEAFDKIINDANDQADFADVLGLPRRPIESDNPLLHVNLKKLNKDNIMKTQSAYINFLKDNNNDLTVINDEFYARDILYSDVIDKTDDKETIDTIKSGLKDVYSFSASHTLVSFGNQLAKKDVVCTCAILRVDLDEYDFYDLLQFRPDCNVSQSEFQDMEDEASEARNSIIMNNIVKKDVSASGTKSLTEILGSVQDAYDVSGDVEMKTYGQALTEQDIACSIAIQFPSIQIYDGIDLTSFRPDCSAVTQSDFLKLKQEAARLQKLDSDIQNSLSVCDQFGFCPCIKDLASSYHATQDEVKASIVRVEPARKKYCGTGCSCVTLNSSM